MLAGLTSRSSFLDIYNHVAKESTMYYELSSKHMHCVCLSKHKDSAVHYDGVPLEVFYIHYSFTFLWYV